LGVTDTEYAHQSGVRVALEKSEPVRLTEIDTMNLEMANRPLVPQRSGALTSSRYRSFIMPSALLVFGLVGTFAWVMFLGWCMLNLVL
jgi:hypothetical protein